MVATSGQIKRNEEKSQRDGENGNIQTEDHKLETFFFLPC